MTTSRNSVGVLAVVLSLSATLAALAGCGVDRAADPGDAASSSSSSSAAGSPSTDASGGAGEAPYAADQVVASLAVTGGICGTRCDEQTRVLGDHSWSRSSGAGDEFGELDDRQWQTLLAAIESTTLDDTSLKERQCPGVADFRTVTYAWTADAREAEVALCDLAAPSDDPLVQWWRTLAPAE